MNRLKVAIDTESYDLGYKECLAGVAEFLKCNNSTDVVLYLLEENLEIAKGLFGSNSRVMLISSPKSAKASVPASEVLRDIIETNKLDLEKRKFAFTMSQSIYDTITGKADVAVLAGHSGHAAGIARAIERNLDTLNPDIPICLGVNLPNAHGIPRMIMDMGAIVNQDLFKLAVLAEYYMQYGVGVKCPKVGFLNIGTEETKGGPEIREASKRYRELYPKNSYGEYGFIEPNNLIGRNECNAVICDAFHGNLAIKSMEGTYTFVINAVTEYLNSSILKQALYIPVGHAFKSIFAKYNPDLFLPAILFGFSKLITKVHGNCKAKSLVCALKNIPAYKLSFDKFQDHLKSDTKFSQIINHNASQSDSEHSLEMNTENHQDSNG